MSNETYRSGDFWRICDVCGFKHRASETSKRWDGLMVCAKDWEPRHPQDYVRSKPDRMIVPMARPEAPDQFVGGQTLTADDGITPLQTDYFAEISA